MPRVLLWGLLAACLFGCATPRPPVIASPPAAPAAQLEAANRLLDEGCYRCLLEAFAIYEKTDARDRMFEAALLLALREKELGLAATGWVERARSLASERDAPLIEIVTAAPWIPAGLALDYEPASRPSTEVRRGWLDLLRETPTRLHRYLELALVCTTELSAPPEGFQADSPLLLYRVGICGPSERAHLDSAFAASTRFADSGYFLARYEMRSPPPGGTTVTRALPLLLSAHDAIPDSPTISVTLATVWVGRKEFNRALTLYDEVLRTLPSQRDALLGRARVLTYLDRPEAAIEAATRAIDLGTWYLGDAYYWRAWNRYARGQLSDAAADVVESKKLQSNGDLFTLSGMIAYDQQRRQEARADFDAALRINVANCPAYWYRGLIEVDERQWEPGLRAFANATGCYTLAVTEIQAEVDAPDLSPDALEQQQQDRARRLTTNQRQIARSALNTALLAMQVGDRDTAMAYARMATTHELTKERAEDVLRRASTAAASGGR